MKTIIKRAGVPMLCGIVLAMATILQAASSPSGDWAVDSTEGDADKIQITAVDDSVTVAFGAQGQPPQTLSSDLLVGAAGAEGVFSGDLSAQGFSGIRLKINGTGIQPSEVSVVVRRILRETPFSYRTWRYSRITVSTTPGEWTIAEIPLVRSAGWTTAGEYKLSSNALDDLWQEDLAYVDALYVRIQSDGLLAQAYSVGDFRLLGEGIISAAANLSPLQAYFGINSFEELTAEELAALMARDNDGDGMSDYHELLAGFDPHNAESVFAARVAVGPASNVISWQGILGKTYAVWRSNNLKSGFTMIAGNIECTVTGPMSFEDKVPVAGKPHFYKVVNQ